MSQGTRKEKAGPKFGVWENKKFRQIRRGWERAFEPQLGVGRAMMPGPSVKGGRAVCLEGRPWWKRNEGIWLEKLMKAIL